MNKIKGAMDVRLTLDEVNEINSLIERNTAKAVRADDTLAYCPNCDKAILDLYIFCPRCGQRLDQENKAL